MISIPAVNNAVYLGILNTGQGEVLPSSAVDRLHFFIKILGLGKMYKLQYIYTRK